MADKFKDWNFTQPDKEQNYSGKGGTAWKFKKSAANNLYNEGDRITNSHDPVWDLRTGGQPITKKHTPCGYWTNETIYVYWVFTSLTYPLEVLDELKANVAVILSGTLRSLLKSYMFEAEAIDTDVATIQSGTLRTLLRSYILAAEAIDTDVATIRSGTLRTLLRSYILAEEAIDTEVATIRSVILDKVLISYTNWPAEALDTDVATIERGTLTTP